MRKVIVVGASAALACASGQMAGAHQNSPDGTVVEVSTGKVRGLSAQGHRVFHDIPYAAPPTGRLRWRKPAPAAAWKGTRDGTKPGPACPQPVDEAEGRPMSEDCLILNVWTPAKRSDKPLPVMVWIHGGAFMSGSSGLYRPERLASRGGIVVVTINYRIGALGFLHHPALPESGNLGILDQQAALKWVRHNIAAFGGNPDKVTIAGESAGGLSICAHLASPGSAGLFHGAIMQSGACLSASRSRTRKASVAYAAELGCKDAACLRALPAAKLSESVLSYGAGGGVFEGPVPSSDGRVLPDDLVHGGPRNNVPVVIGTTSEELKVPEFWDVKLARLSKKKYVAQLERGFGRDAERIARRYPPSKYGGKPVRALGAAGTDGLFSCPAYWNTKEFRKRTSVYQYEFADPHPTPAGERRALYEKFKPGTLHAAELPYLFDFPGTKYTPRQRKLSDQMIGYWSRFVATGDPNGPGSPVWPHDRMVWLHPDGIKVTTDFGDRHQCGFWKDIPAYPR